MDRYSFFVRLFHPLPLAGLSRRTLLPSFLPSSSRKIDRRCPSRAPLFTNLRGAVLSTAPRKSGILLSSAELNLYPLSRQGPARSGAGAHYAAFARAASTLASTFTNDFAVHLKGWAVSFHSLMNVRSRCSRILTSGKFGAVRRLR